MEYFTRRQSSARRTVIAVLAFLVTAVVACSAAGAADAQGAQSAQPAQWVQKKIYFVYMGFTTNYSCDGLRDTVRAVLLQLGARKQGMDVREFGCTAYEGVPERNPGVSGSFYVLQPVPEDQTGSSGGTAVAAHWQTVNVQLSRSVREQAGQCELLEQVKQKILPLFNARNVQFQTNCFPNQFTLPGAKLRVDVLKADQAAGRDVAHSD